MKKLATLVAGIGLVGAFGVSGCSSIEGLASAGTGTEIIMMSAVNDVVLGEGYEIHVAPICDPVNDGTITATCKGKTAEGEEITARLEGKDGLSVHVAGEQIFKGKMSHVIEKEMRSE